MPQTYYFIIKIWRSRKWVKSGPWWPYLVDLASDDFPRLFQFQKIQKFLKWVPKIQGVLFLRKKKAPARKHPVVVRMGFTKNRWFPGFGWKNRVNPKDEMIKNDARHHIYPLECPKPIILLKKIWKSREWVKSGPWWPYLVDLRSIKLLYSQASYRRPGTSMSTQLLVRHPSTAKY